MAVGYMVSIANCASWRDMYNLTHPVLSDSLAAVSDLFMPYMSFPYNAIVDPNHVLQYAEYNFQYGAIRSTLESLMSPEIAVYPDRLDFGSVVPGTSESRTFVIDNAGTGILDVLNVSASNSQFQTAPTTGEIYAVGDSMEVTVTFTPSQMGEFSDSLVITTSIGETLMPLSAVSENVAIDDLIVAVRNADIILSWSAIPGVQGYNIYGSSNQSITPEPENFIGFTGTNNYTDGSVLSDQGNTEKFYCVTAVFDE